MHIRLSRTFAVVSFIFGVILSPLVFGNRTANAETAVIPCDVPPTPVSTAVPETTPQTATPTESPPSAVEVSSPSPIRFSEFFPDPVGDDVTQEFLEIENPGDNELDLAGWRIEETDGKIFALGVHLGPGAYYSFLHPETKISLVNSGATLILRDPSGAIADSISYPGPAKTGKTYARTAGGAWKWTSIPTPGSANEFEPEIPAPSPEPPTVHMSPPAGTPAPAATLAEPPVMDVAHEHVQLISVVAFQPDPIGDDGAEWVAISNDGAGMEILDGWSLDDKDGGSMPFQLTGLSVPAGGKVVIPRTASKIILNNDADEVRLFGPDGLARQTIPYSNPPEGKTYEFGNGTWRWTPSDDANTEAADAAAAIPVDPAPPDGSDAAEPVVQTEIIDLDSLDDDTLAEISGSVSVPPGIVGKRTFAVQSDDGSAGTFVRAYGSAPMPPLNAGDNVRIMGRASRTKNANVFSTIGERIVRISAGEPTFHERTVEEIDLGDSGIAVTAIGVVTHRGKASLTMADDGMRREIIVRTGKSRIGPEIVSGTTIEVRGVVRSRSDVLEIITLEPGAIVAVPAQVDEKTPLNELKTVPIGAKAIQERGPLVFGDSTEQPVPWLAIGGLAASALTASFVFWARRRHSAELDGITADR